MAYTCLDSLGLTEEEKNELIDKAKIILGDLVLNEPDEESENFSCYEKAVCYQAKYLYKYECDIIRPNSITSSSIRNLRLSYGTNTGGDLIDPLAYKVLLQCGLYSSVIDVDCPCGCL